MVAILRIAGTRLDVQSMRPGLVPYRSDQTPGKPDEVCHHFDVPGTNAGTWAEKNAAIIAFLGAHGAALKTLIASGGTASGTLDIGVMFPSANVSMNILVTPDLQKLAGDLGLDVNFAVYLTTG
jgi:hypothetical protein